MTQTYSFRWMPQSPSKFRKHWRRWTLCVVIGFMVLAGIGPPYGLRRDRDTYRCQTCFSRRHEYQWKVGRWSEPSMSVSPRRIVLEESRIYQHFVPPNHEHNWSFFQGSPYYWFGTTWGGCALGGNRQQNDLVNLLESPDDQAFGFISGKLKTGELTTNQLVSALAALRPSFNQTTPQTDAQILVSRLTDEFFSQPSSAGH